MKISDKGIVLSRTRSLFKNKVVAMAIIGMSVSVAPSVKEYVETGRWDRTDNWVMISALGGLIGTVWTRYIDDDGPLHTPGWMPGRNQEEKAQTLTEFVVDHVEDLIKK